LEHPEIWGGMIDLPVDGSAGAEALLNELLAPDGEDHIAYRDGERCAARLTPGAWAADGPLPLRGDGVYLVTGGLGYLGLRAARWMIRQGARHLVLVGRRSLPAPGAPGAGQDAETRQRVKSVQALRALGADVEVLSVDIGEPAQVAGLFERIGAAGLPLRGIVHAAGVSARQPLADVEMDDPAVFRAKVAGSWLLWRHARELEPDFFLMFSSASSVWGAKGQGLYSAANHFLDSLAHHCRRQGTRALSVNWGLLSSGGIVADEYYDWYKRIGLREFQPEQGFEAMSRAAGAGAAQATVARVNWTRFKEVYESQRTRPLLAELAGEEGDEASGADRSSDVVRELQAAKVGERWDRLIECLQREVGAVLGLDPARLPDPRRGFFDLGMDSLASVELRKRLETVFGSSFPSTLAFDYPTIRNVAEYAAANVLGWEPTAGAAAAPGEAAPTADEIEQLSDQEVDASIAGQMEELEELMGQSPDE